MNFCVHNRTFGKTYVINKISRYKKSNNIYMNDYARHYRCNSRAVYQLRVSNYVIPQSED
jgi:hypothetical protein